mmetsp:Transcript_21047/g.50788  ORF Transcript_21047/g.50788 Transcript_21047/m.50788 type:complete len:355 (-) Transcript_21047:357-1421(-)
MHRPSPIPKETAPTALHRHCFRSRGVSSCRPHPSSFEEMRNGCSCFYCYSFRRCCCYCRCYCSRCGWNCASVTGQYADQPSCHRERGPSTASSRRSVLRAETASEMTESAISYPAFVRPETGSGFLHPVFRRGAGRRTSATMSLPRVREAGTISWPAPRALEKSSATSSRPPRRRARECRTPPPAFRRETSSVHPRPERHLPASRPTSSSCASSRHRRRRCPCRHRWRRPHPFSHRPADRRHLHPFSSRQNRRLRRPTRQEEQEARAPRDRWDGCPSPNPPFGKEEGTTMSSASSSPRIVHRGGPRGGIATSKRRPFPRNLHPSRAPPSPAGGTPMRSSSRRGVFPRETKPNSR